MREFATKILVSTLLFHSEAYGLECEVTVPTMEQPDHTLSSTASHHWHGSNELAALIPADGQWAGMGPDRNYFDKFWWWRIGYVARGEEAQPDLTISATRTDGQALKVLITDATSGYGENWDAMLVGMEFPTEGCWKVTGSYQGHELQMTFRVGDE
jgi:hypothetical protein